MSTAAGEPQDYQSRCPQPQRINTYNNLSTELHIVAPDPLAVNVDDQHMVAATDEEASCETRKRTTSLDAPTSKRRQLVDTDHAGYGGFISFV